MSREHIYAWVQSVATHLEHIFETQKTLQKQLSKHKNSQSKNADLRDQRLIPVTLLDSNYTMIDAFHTQTAMSTKSLHIVKQM